MQLYNTLSKKKETFVPPTTGPVKMYTCGPTVYDYVHIGNLRSYVAADTLRRVLTEVDGLEVQHVKNITDVGHLTADDLGQGDSGEDKLVKKATKEGKTPEEIADFYTEYYHATEAKLNILPAHTEPRATHYVAEMIAFIERLLEKGYAYEKNGNVFFDVTQFKKYGELSGNTLDKLRVGARLEEHPDKKNPWDFALWLKAPEGHLMRWESPWSVGYPGWHIECSAMNLATLGETIDIHTGGEDNIFPHHEAEIAQSECGNGTPFAHYWVHTRHLLVSGEKMSKSKGNFYRLEDIEARGFSPMDLRMLYLSAHYRSQMNFTWEALAQAKKNKEAIFAVIKRLQQLQLSDSSVAVNADFSEYLPNIKVQLRDDLNTPNALAFIRQYAKDLNKLLDEKQIKNAEQILSDWKKIVEIFGLTEDKTEDNIKIQEDVAGLLNERMEARINKDFAFSDVLRDKINEFGYIIKDGPKSAQTITTDGSLKPDVNSSKKLFTFILLKFYRLKWRIKRLLK